MDRGQCKLYYATLKSYGVVLSYNSINPMTVIPYATLTLHITRLHIFKICVCSFWLWFWYYPWGRINCLIRSNAYQLLYIYVYIYIHIYIHTYMYIHMYTHIYISAYAYESLSLSLHIYMYIYIYIRGPRPLAAAERPI